MKLLKGLKVANFTTRLPGPLACKLLADLGAKATKWECTEEPDAFIKSELAKNVSEFPLWYRSLNKKSLIKQYNYDDCANAKWVKKNLSSFNALILPVSRHPALKKMITHWRKIPGTRICLEIGGKRDGGPMQDLIALAQAGILDSQFIGSKKNTLPLPVLPIAGMVFGHQIALEIVGLWAQASHKVTIPRRKIFLEDICQNNLKFFVATSHNAGTQNHPLHQGSTPCYQLYPLKDGKTLALACIERKHYLEVQKLLNMPVSADDRLNKSKINIKKLAAFFSKLTSAQIRLKINSRTPGLFIF